MKKLLFILALAAIAVGLVYLYRRYVSGSAAPATPVPTAVVTNRPLISLLEETGTIRPRNQVVIKSEVNGRVDRIYVRDGDVVTAGCILVELDKTDLLNRRRELELDLKEAMLMLESAELDFRRNADLYAQRLVSPDVYDRIRIERNLKENRVEKIKSQITTIEDNLRKTTISAPIAGTVINRAIEVGEVVIGASSVSSGTELMKLADLDLLEVRATINEVDILNVHTGVLTLITVDGIPGSVFTGIVEHVAPVSVSDPTGQVKGFEVVVVLTGSYRQLKPGMTANVKFTRGSLTNALVAPLAAVFCDDYEAALADQTFYVFVQTPTGFIQQRVWIGLNDLTGVQIISGITANTIVALERPPQSGVPPTTRQPSVPPPR
ncbi:MAG: efflux RND transporter periplasmic adaptor subunit [bacterium]|nr:efflux RND transporter periplasmic adaptor subunit [bacterium]